MGAVVQSRITNPFDLRVIFKMFGHRKCVLADAIHPKPKGLDTLHDQE